MLPFHTPHPAQTADHGEVDGLGQGSDLLVENEVGGLGRTIDEGERAAVLALLGVPQHAEQRGNSGADAFAFHGHLTTERPDLLPSGPDDPWQKVHGWLLRAQEVAD